MISEESCDTEDWSNDAENTALITGINYILKYIKIENCYFISQYYWFYCIFDRDFQKTFKHCTDISFFEQ